MGSKQTKLDDKESKSTSTEIAEEEGIVNVQCLKHTTVAMPIAEPMTDAHPEEDVSMFPAEHPAHIALHVFSEADHHEILEEGCVFVDFCVKLMPHQHTLFCERRVSS